VKTDHLEPLFDEIVADMLPDETETYELEKERLLATAVGSAPLPQPRVFRGENEFLPADAGVYVAAANLVITTVRFVRELLAEREKSRQAIQERWRTQLVGGGMAEHVAASISDKYGERLVALVESQRR
jgi:hypothetical protein